MVLRLQIDRTRRELSGKIINKRSKPAAAAAAAADAAAAAPSKRKRRIANNLLHQAIKS